MSILVSLAKVAQLRCFLLSVPCLYNGIQQHDWLSSKLCSHLSHSSSWQYCCSESSSSFFGNPVHAPRWIAVGFHNDAMNLHFTFPPTVVTSACLSQCINASMNRRSEHAFTFGPDHCMWAPLPPSHQNAAQFHPLKWFTVTKTTHEAGHTPLTINVQHPDFPAPAPSHIHDGTCFERSYGIPFIADLGISYVRAATSTEILRTY